MLFVWDFFVMAFSLNFYLNLDNRLKSNVRAIYCYIRQNYQTFTLHTSQKIDPKFWDSTKQRVKKSHPNALEFNAFLDKFKLNIENKFREFFANNPDASFGEFRHFLTARKDLMFFDLFYKYLEYKKATGNPSVAQKVLLLKKHFGVFDGVYLNNIDVQKLDEFKINLVKNKISINTRHKYFQFLFAIFRFGLERGISVNRAFESYKFENKVETTLIALTRSDVEKIQNAVLNERLDKVRDVFLFQLYTGQRYSDILSFNKLDLNGDIWFLRVRKTKKTLQIPMIEPAKVILEKYNYELPKISNQKQNKYLKELGEICGLNEIINVLEYSGNDEVKKEVPKFTQITTHTARRTFVSLASYEGLSQQVVKSVTGHTTDRMLEQYFKRDITETKKSLNLLFYKN